MSGVAGRHVVLGVSGGIASYKACVIARRLTEAGALVDVVMTAAATEFVRPLVFEALTGRPVATSLWEQGRALDHVRLGRESDLVLVAPATARLVARAAQGLADDLLTALLLACRVPVLLCPAMNDQMLRHPETQLNLTVLRERGVQVLGPAVGPLARGEGDGPGRMVEPEEIVASVERMLRAGPPFAGRRVLVTAGPTREEIDPVRVVTNRSSGRMGYALARAAWLRGADVTLVTGPTTLDAPPGVDVVRIETTADLQAAVEIALPSADVLLMAAAPADYRPARSAATKTARDQGELVLSLEPTPDVLVATREYRKPGAVMVGFALEAGGPVSAKAAAKLRRKGLDLVVANDAEEPGAGPEGETNRVTLIGPEDETPLPLARKDEVAEVILDRVAELLGDRA